MANMFKGCPYVFFSAVKNHWKHCSQCVRLLSTEALERAANGPGPWSEYSRQVAAGTLSRDPHQETVVRHLQQIYEDVSTFKRPIIQTQSSLFSFFKRNEPEKIVAPKGLYIFGSVGGGKTMLMDLFYETVPVRIVPIYHLIQSVSCIIINHHHCFSVLHLDWSSKF